VLDHDTLVEQVVEERLAGHALEGLAFGADLGVRKDDDFGHEKRLFR
jgi:hypothetical protein